MRNSLKQYNQSNPFVIILNSVRMDLQTKIVQFTRIGLIGGIITIGIDLFLFCLILFSNQEGRYGALLGYATIWTLFAIAFPLEIITRVLHSQELVETELSLNSAATSELLIMNNEKLFELTRRLERVIGRLEFARTFYILTAALFGIVSVIVIALFL